MTVIVSGVVVDGRVLPEGMRVEVLFESVVPPVFPELAAEFDAWGQASNRAIGVVESATPDATW